MNAVRFATAVMAVFTAATPVAAEIVMFSQRNFQGARYALEKDSSNIVFSPRSARVAAGDVWEICPRPFFGGKCMSVSANKPGISLPRAFSGVVRSARLVSSAPEVKGIKPEPLAKQPLPDATTAPPAVEPQPRPPEIPPEGDSPK